VRKESARRKTCCISLTGSMHTHTHTHNSMGKQNLNKQYIIEGLSAGFLVVVGSMGCILLTVCAIKV
jgi:hypothetical protein